MDMSSSKEPVQKIAFCFMSKKDVVHLKLWQKFFAPADADKYKIIIHMSDPTITVSDLSNVTIIPRQPTTWGSFSLIEVQQSLFTTAFQDPDVYKFILISGDTIPLYTFDTIYSAMMATDKGILRYSAKPYDEKYKINRSAWSSSLPFAWSTTSQWITLNRSHVSMLETHFPMLRAVFGSSDLPDEHAYSVLFHGLGQLDTFVTREDVSHIYVNWKLKPHPATMTALQRKQNTCRINHRIKPWTYHSHDFDPRTMAMIYGSRSLFLRKVCESVNLDGWVLRTSLA